MASGDVENPIPPDAGGGTANKKRKVIALSALLVGAIVVVVAIVLGLDLGGKSGSDASSANNYNGGTNTPEGDLSDGGGGGGGGGGEGSTVTTTTTTLPSLTFVTDSTLTQLTNNEISSVITSTTSTTTPLSVTDPIVNETSISTTPTLNEDKGTTATAPPVDNDTATMATATATDGPPEVGDPIATPKLYQSQYLTSNGPILAKVRMINPSVATGYVSCTNMRADMLNALKHYANSIIVQDKNQDWYESCDPNNPYPIWNEDDDSGGIAYLMESEVMAMEDESSPSKADGSAASTAKEKEDSFETNNQVDGVDEGDIVKSDGDYVYAAYGDLLYVWNATDGTKGISVTNMPYEEINETECAPNIPVLEVKDVCTSESGSCCFKADEYPVCPGKDSDNFCDGAKYCGDDVCSCQDGLDFCENGTNPCDRGSEPSPEEVQATEKASSNRHHRKASVFFPRNPCHKAKPRILSLLLQGSRLTVIVSEDDWRGSWHNQDGTNAEPDPIINDYTKLSLRVYDVSNVPTDGSPLEFLGEKVIKGNYDSARSVGDTGFVITQSYVNKWAFIRDIHRSSPQYCGLTSTEYETLAAEIALNRTEAFLERMMEEMELQMDGSCNSIFQVSAMQSGDNEEDSTGGDMLSSFVQVLSFNMSLDFPNNEVSTNVAGAFSSGSISSVYASQEFVATLNTGSMYNKTSRSWDQATFILGFDISDTTPKPFCYAEIPGQSFNQYATDLYDGHLRVVTTERKWSATPFESRTTNKIFILKVPEENEGQEMRKVGETGHLGKPNEDVYAVRFIGPKAYIVTFENTDPFYIYDLADPADPKKLGELEIPGFSNYLHPIEIDRVELMLGVGEHVNNTTGRSVGVKISLFDVSDPTNPTENATFIDKGAYSSAGNDFKAFRYLPLSKKLILPKSKWTWSNEGNFDDFDGFVVLDVKLGSVTRSYEIQHAESNEMHNGCWYNAYMPARSFVFQSKLTTILSHSVLSTDLESGGKLWNITLGEGLENKVCSSYFYRW